MHPQPEPDNQLGLDTPHDDQMAGRIQQCAGDDVPTNGLATSPIEPYSAVCWAALPAECMGDMQGGTCHNQMHLQNYLSPSCVGSLSSFAFSYIKILESRLFLAHGGSQLCL